jgi:hypothetical protein
VLKPDAAGYGEIRVQFRQLVDRYIVANEGPHVVFSMQPPVQQADEPMAALWAELARTGFSIRTDPAGGPIRVKGITEAVSASGKKAKPGEANSLALLIMGGYGDTLPEEPMAVGETWKTKDPVPLFEGKRLDLEKTHEFSRIEKTPAGRIAVITVQADRNVTEEQRVSWGPETLHITKDAFRVTESYTYNIETGLVTSQDGKEESCSSGSVTGDKEPYPYKWLTTTKYTTTVTPDTAPALPDSPPAAKKP